MIGSLRSRIAYGGQVPPLLKFRSLAGVSASGTRSLRSENDQAKPWPRKRNRKSQKELQRPAKKSLLMGVIVPVVLVTLLAGGGGFAFGSFVIGKPAAKPAAEETAHAAEGEKPAEGEEAAEGDAHKSRGRPRRIAGAPSSLPIVTNLQSPKDTWIRLRTECRHEG